MGRSGWISNAVAWVVVMVGVGTGCVANPAPTTEVDAGFVEMLDSLVGQAQDAGASAAQIAALDKARQEGDVSFALLTESVNATLDCFDGASIAHQVSTDDSQALPLLDYSYESAESGNPVADACIVANSYFVEAAYQNQPRWRAVVDARIVLNREAIIVCLRDLGVTIDDDATADEITQSTHISTDELHKYLDAGSRVPVDCLFDYGAN